MKLARVQTFKQCKDSNGLWEWGTSWWKLTIWMKVWSFGTKQKILWEWISWLEVQLIKKRRWSKQWETIAQYFTTMTRVKTAQYSQTRRATSMSVDFRCQTQFSEQTTLTTQSSISIHIQNCYQKLPTRWSATWFLRTCSIHTATKKFLSLMSKPWMWQQCWATKELRSFTLARTITKERMWLVFFISRRNSRCGRLSSMGLRILLGRLVVGFMLKLISIDGLQLLSDLYWWWIFVNDLLESDWCSYILKSMFWFPNFEATGEERQALFDYVRMYLKIS